MIKNRMIFEKPKQYSEEEIAEMEKMRERVDNLKRSDEEAHDTVIYDLAGKEKETREKKESNLKSLRLLSENEELSPEELSPGEKAIVGMEANDFSTETLGRLEAEKEKFTDELTGLRNRNALEIEIPGILSLEKREQQMCSLLMIDVDLFKEFNDGYGHQKGDEVIKLIANIIKNSCRASDLIYRFGGDEFTVLFPNTGLDNAKGIVERIKVSLNEANEKRTINADLKLTLSIGISFVDYSKENENKNMEDLIKEADVALYQSKEIGRNTVSVFERAWN